MSIAVRKWGIIAGVAATFALAALAPSVAAPLSTGATALKSAVPSDVADVRWRRRHRWGGFATGLAIGALAARPYYYDPPHYYYGPPPAHFVAPPRPYYYGPTYVEPYPDPNGPIRQCWVSTDSDRGYGYFRPC
jgi:hypothetical protein